MPAEPAPVEPPLRDPARRRPVPEDLRRIWARRHFIWYSAVSDLRAREMDTALGNAWHLLSPALHIAVYYVVFGLLLGTDRGLDNFLPFLAIGVFSFDFMRRTVIGGGKSLAQSRGLIESIPFPRAMLPLSVTVVETIALIPPAIVIAVLSAAAGGGVSLRWLTILPIFAIQCLFSTGLGFVAARLTFHIRDFDNVIPILFRLAFYMSGVLHLMEEYVTDPTLLTLVNLNPFYAYISLYRWALMGLPVDPMLVTSAMVWALAASIGGYLWFQRKEKEYGRE